jgi:hypothetical protein
MNLYVKHTPDIKKVVIFIWRKYNYVFTR